MNYLKKTIDSVSIVGENIVDFSPWVDAAYAVHDNMKIQTGGTMHFGDGTVHCQLRKQ